MEFQSLNQIFYDRVKESKDKPFLWSKKNEIWNSVTWGEDTLKVKELASGLKSHGIKPGDRVVIVSENRPEWIIADLAITLIGGITVPAYTTNTEDDHQYIIKHSEAKAVIASSNILANRLALAITRTKICKLLITIDNYNGFEMILTNNFDEVLHLEGIQ